jgi:hypothetical protein
MHTFCPILQVWVSVRYCCGAAGCCPVGCSKGKCCCLGRTKKPPPQFIIEGDSAPASLATSPDSKAADRFTCCGMGVWEAVLVWLIMVVGILLIALSVWGLAYALPSTDDLVPEFWGIVDVLEAKVGWGRAGACNISL